MGKAIKYEDFFLGLFVTQQQRSDWRLLHSTLCASCILSILGAEIEGCPASSLSLPDKTAGPLLSTCERLMGQLTTKAGTMVGGHRTAQAVKCKTNNFVVSESLFLL